MSFEERSAAFEKWLVESGVTISPKISIEDLRSAGQGRGIIATEDIEDDTEIFSIPRSKLLNLKNSDLYKSASESAKESLVELGQWESLILAILWEWKVKGPVSEWAGYIDVLPLNDSSYKSDQLIYWNEEELKLLSPSLIVDRIGKDAISDMYNGLFPEFVTGMGFKELTDVTQDEFEKVGSVIMSYSFDVEEEEQEKTEEEDVEDEDDEEEELVKCMIALADTLNADTHLRNANLIHTPEALVMKTTSKISKGEQVYNTYLDHPNAEILRRYGYVEYKGSKNDFGEVTLENIKDCFSTTIPFIDDLIDIIHEEIDLDEIEEGAQLLTESYDCFGTSEVIPELRLLIQFLVVIQKVNEKEPIIEEDNETTIKSIQRIFKKCVQLIEQERLTTGFIEQYKAIIQYRIDEYPLVVEVKDSSRSREDLAKVVLKSEVDSLKSCLDVEKVFKDFKIIDDDKLLRGILKKRVGKSEEFKQSKSKKQKK